MEWLPDRNRGLFVSGRRGGAAQTWLTGEKCMLGKATQNGLSVLGCGDGADSQSQKLAEREKFENTKY